MTVADLAARLLATAEQPGLLLDVGQGQSRGVIRSANAAAEALFGHENWKQALTDELALRAVGQSTGEMTLLDDTGAIALRAGFACHQLDDRYLVVWLSPDTGEAHRGRPAPADDDPVTGMPGRSRLGVAARTYDRRSAGAVTGMVLLGLDVRTRAGSELDQRSLSAVGRELTGQMRDGDVVTHLGSGRFAMLLTGLTGIDDVQALERRLGRAASHALPGPETPTVALATEIALDPGVDMDSALADLDEMLAEAAGAHETLRSGALSERGSPGIPVSPDSFRHALDHGELRLHYQPVVNIHDERAGGAEALIRWQHPTLGLLAPRAFLAMADRAVGAVRLGEWVIESAVRQTAAWDAVADLSYYRVGINLSPRQFAESDVAGTIARMLERYGVPGERFAVEILESEAIGSTEDVAATVLRLRAMGLRVAIDDFGSGFATMSYLRDLPIDLIKIDRSLVGLLPTSRERAILSAVCSIARATGADVLLEGVERVEQLELARDAGVTFAQGMLVGPPGAPGDLPPRPRPLPATGQMP